MQHHNRNTADTKPGLFGLGFMGLRVYRVYGVTITRIYRVYSLSGFRLGQSPLQ